MLLGLLVALATCARGGERSTSSGSDTPPVACRLDAFTKEENARHAKLITALAERVQDKRELSKGYEFRLDDSAKTFTETAEWITLERRCCPFFEFTLTWTEARGSVLRIEGPKGAKEMIRAAM
jgi:hypothetical protein